jgi:hypothetical protein
MNSDHLVSSKAKISRAKEIFREIEVEIQAMEGNKSHGILFSHQFATDELVLSIQTPNSLFIRSAVLAGEVVHQTRSALDHAVWELVPMPILGKTGFPVFTAKSKTDAKEQNINKWYDRDGVRMIDGINSAASTIIGGVQPFESHFQTNLLFILNELWNRDKHRLLNTCLVIPLGISLLYHFPDGRWNNQIIQVPDNLVYGTELFREHHPGKEVEVMAQVAFTSLVFTDGPVARQPVLELLSKLIQFSEKTIMELAETV